MSFVPGADGEKSVFKDDIQVNHLSENTVGHGVRVRGVSDPTTYPVLAGDVGEVFGTAAAGTGGTGYSSTNTTGLTNTMAAVISLTLNKGVYFVSGMTRHYGLAGTPQVSMEIWVGGTRVTPVEAVVNGVTTATSGSCSLSLPIVITSDSTVVAVAARISTGADGGGINMISAVRIA